MITWKLEDESLEMTQIRLRMKKGMKEMRKERVSEKAEDAIVSASGVLPKWRSEAKAQTSLPWPQH